MFALILESCQRSLQQAKSLEEKKMCMQLGVKLLQNYSLLVNEIESLEEAHFREAKKHGEISVKYATLERFLTYMKREILALKQQIVRLREGNNQLVRQNKKMRLTIKNLRKENEKVHGALLGQKLSNEEAQRRIQAKDRTIKEYESSAREKDRKIEQCGNFTEQSAETIQKMENLTQQVSKLQKQLQRTDEFLTKMFQQAVQNQQETKTAIREMDARIQEDKIYFFPEPVRTNDASLPVMYDADFNTQPAFSATSYQQAPVQSSSSDMVNFEPLRLSYNNEPVSSGDAYMISHPLTPTSSSLRSLDLGGASLSVPFQPEWQNDSWPGSSIC
ncbi:hypothetical protein MY11210_004934 [Beauveria gryllotalpidicola]